MSNYRYYIDFLNKKNNFREERIVFEGHDAYEQAVKWGKENLGNFNEEMIRLDQTSLKSRMGL